MIQNIDPHGTMPIDALNLAIHEWAASYADATRRDNGVSPEDAAYGYRAMLDEPRYVEEEFTISLGRKPEDAEIAAMWQAVEEGVSQ